MQPQAELTRIETARIESLVETGRQRLEGLIDAALSDARNSGSSSGDGDVGGGGDGGGGVAGAELMRLWEEGKDQLAELAGKGGEVRTRVHVELWTSLTRLLFWGTQFVATRRINSINSVNSMLQRMVYM